MTRKRQKVRPIETTSGAVAALLTVAAAACGGDLDVKETASDAGAGATGGTGGSVAGPNTTSGTVSGSGGSGGSGGTAGVGGSGGGGAATHTASTSSENTTSSASTTGEPVESCLNDVLDGAETDVDCGGPVCLPCPAAGRCEQADDCESGVCDDGFCSPPACDDQVLNGSETDIDCGGADCAACPEVCDCAVSERLSVLNCGSTTIAGTGWPTPGLLSADGSVMVFTRCIGPDPIGGQCGEFDVMRQSGEQAVEPLGAGVFSEVMTPDAQYLVLTDYEAEGMTFLTPEGEEAIEFFGRAVAISDDGEALAVTRYPDTDTKAGRWTRDGGFEELGDIPDGTGVSRATDMSADGSVIVGYAHTATQEVPFIWRDGAIEALTDLPGDATAGQALRVSDDGSTIVGVTAVVSSGESRLADVFRWTESEGFTVIAPVCGELCPERFRLRVNQDGSVVAGTLALDGEGLAGIAFRWTESEGLTEFGLTGDPYTSRVHDMNADGTVIVGQMDPTSESARAYVWDEASGIAELGSLLTASGVDIGGWDFSGGEAQVSADGKVLVGVGRCGGTRALYRAVLPED